jgi:transcriptional regulator with XRE-family HTH domain
MASIEQVAWVRRLAKNGGARAIREAAGISVAELARSIDVSPAAVSLWERGARVPREDLALRYAAALELLSHHTSARRLRAIAGETGFVHISEPVVDEFRRLLREPS